MRFLLPSLMLAVLAGCGGDAAGGSTPETSEPKKETVFDPMVQQLDRARQAADTLPQERKENLDAAIESGQQ